MKAPATWALVVTADKSWVAPRAQRLWERLYQGLDAEVAPWELTSSNQGETVVVDREPGSEGTDEDVAIALSAELAGPVHLLRLRDDVPAVWRFERGTRTQIVSEAPRAWASSRGVRFDE